MDGVEKEKTGWGETAADDLLWQPLKGRAKRKRRRRV